MLIRDLGLVAFQPTFEAMQKFTAGRDESTEDELWLLEHYPVFTQGLNGKSEHVFNTREIPLIQTDRGGQVTYHGPGQLIAYTLFDLKRLNIGVRAMVSHLEKSVINLLDNLEITAQSRSDAPGVYVNGRKIASLGLRVKRGICYHGLSLNVDMDLTPFSYINACGLEGMEMIDLKRLNIDITMEQIKQQFVLALKESLNKS
jgi:lipoyl(octanoyl) transferase